MARSLQKDSETKLPRLQLPWTNETKILSLNPVNYSNNEKESETADTKVGSQTRRPRKQNPLFFGRNWINLKPEVLFDLHLKISSIDPGNQFESSFLFEQSGISI